jgi:hypothetical protein
MIFRSGESQKKLVTLLVYYIKWSGFSYADRLKLGVSLPPALLHDYYFSKLDVHET